MLPLKNIPHSKMQSIADKTPFEQLTFFVSGELDSIFPRLQNSYLIYEILKIVPLNGLLSLRKVSKSYKAVIDSYLSLCSINIFFTRFDYYPKAENIHRLCVSPGALNSDTLESIMPTAPHIKWLELQGNSMICQEYLRQYFGYTGEIEILSFQHYFTLSNQTFDTAIQHNPRLRVLNLSCCNNLNRRVAKTLYRKTPLLEIIILENCPWVDHPSLVKLLSQLPKLRKISVISCPNITFETVQILRKTFKNIWIDF